MTNKTIRLPSIDNITKMLSQINKFSVQNRRKLCVQCTTEVYDALQNGKGIISNIDIRKDQLKKGTIKLQIYRYHCINSILHTKKVELSNDEIGAIISNITEIFQKKINTDSLQHYKEEPCIHYEISMDNDGELGLRGFWNSGNEEFDCDVYFNSQEVIETELNKYLETKTTNNKNKPLKKNTNKENRTVNLG